MPQFRAKARAIELLGKGQIADLPTAITELWKNGYDAYAKTLDCKLYLKSYKENKFPFFVLSDDGFGMTEDDITDKWLVLGTDSKTRGEQIESHFNLKPRPPMGEKGIGRLSVSYLGNTLLMITKKENKSPHCLFIDWRILENYKFYLEDLELPTFNFKTLNEFIARFERACKNFEVNLKGEQWNGQSLLRLQILLSVKGLAIPDFVLDEIVQPFLESTYHGTSFLVFNPHEQLLELDANTNLNYDDDLTVRYLRSSLTGLHNDLNGSTKDFSTTFDIYSATGKYDLIENFFTQSEMRSGDHWLRGEFDENGFFTGELRVFNQIFKYNFRPVRPIGKTSYGPFKIQWGQFEGALKSSLLNEEQYRIIDDKLEQFGGLYIYRDNFRVLPYGRRDVDFLGFEERRSKRAGEYFFSHRRFIGYIDISRKENPGLTDKAGREGFIQNKAYREFRDDLMEFFKDIALRYLRTVSDEAENTSSRALQLKEIQERFERQKEGEKKKNAKTKTAFLQNLERNGKAIYPLKEEINSIKYALERESERIRINFNNYNSIVAQLDSKRSAYRNMKLSAPRGTKFTKKQEEALRNYQEAYNETEQQIVACLVIVEQNRSRIDIQNLKVEFQSLFDKHLKQLDQTFSIYTNQIKDAFDQKKDDLKSEKESYIEDFIQKSSSLKVLDSDNNEEISKKITLLDSATEEQSRKIVEVIGGFVNQVKNLSIDVNDDYLRGWYKEQSEKLEARLQDYEELAQLGISIEIIDHQFNVMYSQMKSAIQNIKPYVESNRNLSSNFTQLNNAFQHLEGNYNLLRPLYRTSRRTRALITGKEIEDYIRQFFKNEFDVYNINFTVDEGFQNYEFFTYDSIIKPVFLNIINNATYWLIPASKRQIRIEIRENNILIMNSGEKIENSYLEDIFTLFFTKKKDGRGIGLYLAKKNLNSIGYDINATNDKSLNKLNGACFVITKTKTTEENN